MPRGASFTANPTEDRRMQRQAKRAAGSQYQPQEIVEKNIMQQSQWSQVSKKSRVSSF
jgi:hypothetical protein